MSNSLGKAAMSIKLALAAQEAQENQMQLFEQETPVNSLSSVQLEKMVNGYKTCVPLYSAALKGDSDNPIETLKYLSSAVKTIFTKLCPTLELPISEELSQRLFNLRAILISLVATSYAEDRHELFNNDEVSKFLSKTIYDVELFAEPTKQENISFNELYISIKGASFLTAFNNGIEASTCKQYADGVWSNITEIFGRDKTCISPVTNYLLNPLFQLFDSIFDKEHKVHDLQLAAGHEEKLQTEIMHAVLKLHRLALIDLMDCIEIKDI